MELNSQLILSAPLKQMYEIERKKAMKQITSALLSILLIISLVSFTNAKTIENHEVYTTEYYDDGSYGITTITIVSSKAFNSTKTASKSYNHYSASNVLLWTITLTATFTYNGSTASCTNATPSYTMYATTWSVTKSNATYSGNTATGNFTVKRYNMFIPVETVNKTLTLTCSPSGVIT